MFKITKLNHLNVNKTKIVSYDGYSFDVDPETKWIAIDEDGTVCAYLKYKDAPVTVFAVEYDSYWSSFGDWYALEYKVEYEGNWYESLKQVDFWE